MEGVDDRTADGEQSSCSVIGTPAVIAMTVAGQQIASVLVDRLGPLRFPRRELSKLRLAGVAVLLIGVVLIQLF